MTTERERRGALEAVERIVNRGDDVLGETLAVVRRLLPDVELHGRSFESPSAGAEDRELLDRIAVLVSHFTDPARADPVR